MRRLKGLVSLETHFDMSVAALDISNMARMVQHDRWTHECSL